jgi:hypothetical protein
MQQGSQLFFLYMRADLRVWSPASISTDPAVSALRRQPLLLVLCYRLEVGRYGDTVQTSRGTRTDAPPRATYASNGCTAHSSRMRDP